MFGVQAVLLEAPSVATTTDTLMLQIEQSCLKESLLKVRYPILFLPNPIQCVFCAVEQQGDSFVFCCLDETPLPGLSGTIQFLEVGKLSGGRQWPAFPRAPSALAAAPAHAAH